MMIMIQMYASSSTEQFLKNTFLLAIIYEMLFGLAACFIASLAFGTVFVPIKKFPATDGFVTQFFMCTAGFLLSLVIHAAQGFPPMFPIAMIGGALWCAANSFAFMIMNKLGMALGILIWNSVSCITGWATSRYGFFGVPKGVPNSQLANYIGVTILCIGSCFYLFIKSTLQNENKKMDSEIGEKRSPSISTTDSDDMKMKITDEVSILQRIISLIGAFVSGVCYGSMCTPVTYLQNHQELYPTAPLEGLPYLFSFFCGVFPTSTIILVIYSLVHRNQPKLYPELVLPSMIGGLLHCIGMGGFFIANEQLSQTIAYPICSFAPALIVTAWSVFYFKEITGKKNFILLAVAYTFTLVGVIVVTISKTI